MILAERDKFEWYVTPFFPDYESKISKITARKNTLFRFFIPTIESHWSDWQNKFLIINLLFLLVI